MEGALAEKPNYEKKEKIERLKFAGRVLPSERHPRFSEDALVVESELGLAAVFDGMGGHSGGKEAAEIAAKELQAAAQEWDVAHDDEVEQTMFPSLEAILRSAHNKIIKFGIEQGAPNDRMPGTTASIVKFHTFSDGSITAYVMNVGDSRVYYCSPDGRVRQVTVDHDILSNPDSRHQVAEIAHSSELESGGLTDADVEKIREQIDSVQNTKELQAAARIVFNNRNIILGAIGLEGKRRGEVARSWSPFRTAIDIEKGGKIVITSDGVTDNLTRKEIHRIIASNENADVLAETLVQEAHDFAHAHAHEEGGRAKKDDMTAVAIMAL